MWDKEYNPLLPTHTPVYLKKYYCLGFLKGLVCIILQPIASVKAIPKKSAQEL